MKEYLSLFAAFLKVGALMFGGGLSMLPILIREIVTTRKWATEQELLDYYALVQCTPGIIAVNTAAFIGYKRKGILGGILASLAAVIPSLIIILLIATVLSGFLNNTYVLYALAGIRTAVCALLVNTVIIMARKNIVDLASALIAIISLTLLLFTPVPLVVVIVAAALAGVALWKLSGEGKI